jgi:hypothetical protein
MSILTAGFFGPALAADYEVRNFEGGPGWFVYDEPIDVAFRVLHPAEPKCHEVTEMILLFETADQLRDDALIEEAALTGMHHYAALCRSLGVNPSNQLKVSGVVVGAGEPNAQGFVMGDGRVLDAMVGSSTGKYQLHVSRNAVADGTAGATSNTAQKPADDQAAQIAEIRTTYDTALKESEAKAEDPGLLGRLTGGKRAALTGVWSASQVECAKERVILFENSGTGTVEWWRASDEKVGLLPWRTGRWELRDGTVIMNFDHRVEYDDFLDRLRDGTIDETVQFELKSVKESELRLAATGGGISSEALFLGGAEKLFVRCRG